MILFRKISLKSSHPREGTKEVKTQCHNQCEGSGWGEAEGGGVSKLPWLDKGALGATSGTYGGGGFLRGFLQSRRLILLLLLRGLAFSLT